MIITLAFSNDRTHMYNLAKGLKDTSSDFSIVEIDVADISVRNSIGRQNNVELLDAEMWEHWTKVRYSQSFTTHPDVLLNGVDMTRGRFKGKFLTLKEIIEAWYFSRSRWIYTLGEYGISSGITTQKNLVRVVRAADQLTVEKLNGEIGYAEIITAEYQTSGSY
jgi:hypothetical protein